ncbi:uncharacterized protein LOC128883111 [Hylaeus volcanicus]|uniref:uncharacterized protein LOC128883111 n=1 Tax=Hylaeus volcanicus TaxID=313075 RepID=UPI0023B808CF|nr:uncharacterized protein LOC128883111 [Hylaeus volcanicus]
MTCTTSLKLAKTLKQFHNTDYTTQCVETNVFQSCLWNEESNNKEHMPPKNIKLVHSVVHEELNLVIFLLKPFTLLVLSGYRTCLDNVKEESHLEEDPESSPHEVFNKETNMLGEWYPKEEREHQLMESVGEFHTIAIAQQGMYVFVGTKYGCLVVFSLTLSDTWKASFIYQEKNTSKEFFGTTSQVFLKPFVWSNISKLIDVPEDVNETSSFDILSLHAVNVSQEYEHYVLVALVGPDYLAVVNFDKTNGVTPIDVLNLPSKATISSVSSGGFVSNQWTLNILVYGWDAILFLKATAAYVVLLSYINVSSVSSFLPLHQSCLSQAHLQKVQVSFSSLLNPHSEVYICSCYTLPNQQIIIVLLTFNYLTQHLTIHSTMLQGSFLNATFLIHSLSHHVTCHSPCHMSLDASCLCVITSQNTHLFNLPYLSLVQTLPNPLNICLDQMHQKTEGTHLETQAIHPEGQSPEQNKSSAPFALSVTLTSAIPSQQSMKRIFCEIKKRTMSSYKLSTPLAIFVMQCPNTFHLKGIWFCHKQVYDSALSSNSPYPTSYSLVDPSKNIQDSLFILKQQIEISIERARSHPSTRFSEPLKFCDQIKNFIQVQKNSTKGVSRNFLLYIANIGKSAAFITFHQTKIFLMSLLEILLDEEEACRTFEDHDTKSSSILERVLVKLTTFAVLHGSDHANYAFVEKSPSQSDKIEPSEDLDMWFDESVSLQEIHWVSWTRFLHMDVSKVAFQYASGGDLPKLFFLLNRHLNDIDRNKVARSEKVGI